MAFAASFVLGASGAGLTGEEPIGKPEKVVTNGFINKAT
jgi:hypothetical protein